MPDFLQLLRDILWLRRGPQDVPYAPPLLAALCAAVLVLQIAVSSVLDIPGSSIAGPVLVMLAELSLVYFLLTIRGFANRFVQTGTALVACKLVFLAVAVPITLVVGAPPKSPEQITALQGLLGLGALLILIWKLLVDSHILRHALALPFYGGMGVAIMLIVVEYAFGAALQAPAPPQP